jgi:hypothetical protein
MNASLSSLSITGEGRTLAPCCPGASSSELLPFSSDRRRLAPRCSDASSRSLSSLFRQRRMYDDGLWKLRPGVLLSGDDPLVLIWLASGFAM